MEYCVALGVSYEVVSVSIADQTGKVIDDFLVPTAPDIIDFVLSDLGLCIVHIGVEPGVVGSWLAQELQARGWQASCLEYANMGRQTIKNTPIRHSEQALLIKALIKVRRALLKETVRSYNVLFAILKESGKEFLLRKNLKISFEEAKRRAQLFSESLQELSSPDQYGDFCFSLLEEYTEFEDAEEEVMNKILDLAFQDDDARRLVNIPGVSYIAALYFIIAIEDLQRFTNAKSVVSYLGLAPGQTKGQGDFLVSAFLMAAAARIMRSNQPSSLKAWGLSIARKTCLKVAHRAVARKLVQVMYKILVTKEEYRYVS